MHNLTKENTTTSSSVYIRCLFFITVLFLSCSVYAQEKISAKDSILNLVTRINRTYPTVRPYSIQIDRLSDRMYNANFRKQRIEKGDIEDALRVKSYLTFPSYKTKKFILYGTFTHVYQKISIRNTKSLSADHPQFRAERNIEMHDMLLSINGVYKDSLFGKTAVFTSALIINSRNFKSAEKLKALFTAAIVLKANKNTVITAGLIAMIDPSANLPFTPLFTYWHRLPRQWQFDFILPSRLYLRHPIRNGWFSAGTELSSLHGFQTPDQNILKGKYELSNITLQSGINLEYPVSNGVLLGFRTGVEMMLASRMVKLNGKSSDYVSNSKVDPTMFMSFSLAYVPGMKKN